MSLTLPLALAGCGDGHEGFATLQDCYDEHTIEEALPIQESIVVCCLDHPIDGVNPSCGDTEAECVDHVDAEIDPSISISDIEAACTDYVDEL